MIEKYEHVTDKWLHLQLKFSNNTVFQDVT